MVPLVAVDDDTGARWPVVALGVDLRQGNAPPLVFVVLLDESGSLQVSNAVRCG